MPYLPQAKQLGPTNNRRGMKMSSSKYTVRVRRFSVEHGTKDVLGPIGVDIAEATEKARHYRELAADMGEQLIVWIECDTYTFAA